MASLEMSAPLISASPLQTFITNDTMAPVVFHPISSADIKWRCTAIFTGLASNFTYIPAIMASTQGSILKKIVLPFGNITAFAIVMGYCSDQVMQLILHKPSAEETRLFRAHRTRSIVVFVHSIVGGIAAQTPSAVLSAAYVSNRVAKVAYPIVIYACHSGFSIYSLHLASQDFINSGIYRLRCCGSRFELRQLQETLMAEVGRFHGQFIASTRTDQVELVRRITDDTTSESDKLRMIFSSAIHSPKRKNWFRTITTYAAGAVGAAGTVGLTWLWWNFDKSGADETTSNTIGSYIITAYTTFVVSYFAPRFIPQAAMDFWSYLLDFIEDTYQRSLAEQMHPGVVFTLKLITLLAAMFSWGPTQIGAKDFLSGKDSEITQVFASIGVSIMAAKICFLAIEQFSQLYIYNKGTDEEKMVLELNARLERLMRIIQHSSLLELARGWRDFPADLQAELVRRAGIARDALNAAIADIES